MVSGRYERNTWPDIVMEQHHVALGGLSIGLESFKHLSQGFSQGSTAILKSTAHWPPPNHRRLSPHLSTPTCPLFLTPDS